MPFLTVHPEGEKVPCNPGETILEALYASGYSYRIGCRRGGCGICKVDLRSGQVEYNRTVSDEVLTPEEIADGTCLSCRAVPQADVEIALRDERLKLTNRMLRTYRLKAYEKAAAETADAASTNHRTTN